MEHCEGHQEQVGKTEHHGDDRKDRTSRRREEKRTCRGGCSETYGNVKVAAGVSGYCSNVKDMAWT